MRKRVTVWVLMTMMNYELCLDLTVNSVKLVINTTYIYRFHFIFSHITEIRCEYGV